MEETFNFLKVRTKVNYISTIDGDKPSCRPFGDPVLFGIRINCKLVDDSNNMDAKKAIINEFDWAEEAGYTLDNLDFKVFYLAKVNSTIYDIDGNIKGKYSF